MTMQQSHGSWVWRTNIKNVNHGYGWPISIPRVDFSQKTKVNVIVHCNIFIVKIMSLCDLHSLSIVVKMTRLELQDEMLFVALAPIFSQWICST